MSFGAVIMLLIGAVGLWGGFLLSVAHFLRSSSRERGHNSVRENGDRAD